MAIKIVRDTSVTFSQNRKALPGGLNLKVEFYRVYPYWLML